MRAASGKVHARGGARPDVRVVLDGVEPATAGLRVQVYDDPLAPQLVLENATGRTLEVLDPRGRAFVRIGAAGVEADVAAAAWYRTLSPAGSAVPAAARDAGAPARWRAVRRQVSWGWFDERVAKDALPAAASDGSAVLGRWLVPIRLGGQTLAIRGHFLHQPRPAGVFVARLDSAHPISPSVHVTLSPGPPPALLLANEGPHVVTVIGASGEPFLRIARDGVVANVASPTWQDLGRHYGFDGGLDPGDGERWERVSLAPRYRWLEPRAAMPAVGPGSVLAPDNARVKVKGWRVPLLVGDRAAAIQGVVEWVPLPAPEVPGAAR